VPTISITQEWTVSKFGALKTTREKAHKFLMTRRASFHATAELEKRAMTNTQREDKKQLELKIVAVQGAIRAMEDCEHLLPGERLDRLVLLFEELERLQNLQWAAARGGDS
jgi:hypothetical protein